MRDIEKSVLQTYQRSSPSLTPADTAEEFIDLLARRGNLLRKLNLHPRLFTGAELIDMGCGTGENSSVYAAHGARVSGVEFNPISAARMRALFAKHGLPIGEIFETPISEWTPRAESYDIGVSDGVIHHLSNPREGLAKLALAVRPGGLMIVATAGFPGAEQRRIMRNVVRRNARSLAEAVELSWCLFHDYMKRATEIGRRSAEQIVNDNFLVEQHEPLGLDTVARWFAEEGFSYYRVWPNVEPYVAAAPTAEPVDWFRRPDLLLRNARLWPICRAGDLADLTLPEAEITKGLRELEEIKRLAALNDLDELARALPACEFFGRGYCGAGMYFVVGEKRRAPTLTILELTGSTLAS